MKPTRKDGEESGPWPRTERESGTMEAVTSVDTRRRPSVEEQSTDLRAVLAVLRATRMGEFSTRVSLERKWGIAAELAAEANALVDELERASTAIIRVVRDIGSDANAGRYAHVRDATGSWRDIDQLIASLRDTTIASREQDWLKTNLTNFTAMMQSQRTIAALGTLVMSELTPLVSAQYGGFYVLEGEGQQSPLSLLASYGFQGHEGAAQAHVGEGLIGQCALEKRPIVVDDIPREYLQISSGLGRAAPRTLAIVPVLFEGQIKAIIELASFGRFTPIHLTLLTELAKSIGVVFNMIAANMRTGELLEELRRSNTELATQSRELEEKAFELETRNREIALASSLFQDKARELARTSKYKTDFLANMSHELRTPLNSLLILARLLADNEDGSLGSKPVEYAKTICSSGNDLLVLINEILDLSKIEAGKVEIHRHEVSLSVLREYLERSFRQVATEKRLVFAIRIAEGAPQTITADLQRLRQILRNLLANAFKFTQAGSVALDIDVCDDPSGSPTGNGRALRFSVADTGIGIGPDKQELVFEAFQQADSSTSRTYGGTGLGLTISRELARLLGGDIRLTSAPGAGCTFTLTLPLDTDIDVPPPRSVRERPSEVATASGAMPRTDLSVLHGRKILVVDDDLRNVFAVRSLFGGHGAAVVAAESATAALRVLEQDPEVDLVLMDMMLPEIDGYEATRRIRSLRRCGRLPIIALTAKTMPGDQDRCIEAGCDEFVAKPVDNTRLLAVVGRWLRVASLVPPPSSRRASMPNFDP
jgi:signal transduction histidine kinase/CheY-like chemotaxis protein